MAGGVVAPTTRMRIDQEREAGAAGWEKEERREVTVERRKRRTRVPTRCPSHDESDARRIRGKPRTRTESLGSASSLGSRRSLGPRGIRASSETHRVANSLAINRPRVLWSSRERASGRAAPFIRRCHRRIISPAAPGCVGLATKPKHRCHPPSETAVRGSRA